MRKTSLLDIYTVFNGIGSKKSIITSGRRYLPYIFIGQLKKFKATRPEKKGINA
jgi:hypothetical protein